MNINRDFLIILDVKSGEVDSPNIYYFNTDKNTSNLYVQMVLRETTVEANPIENATDYSIKANILKPNLVAKEVDGVLVNEEKAIYEFKLPADCTDFSGNAKIEFEVYCTVDGVDKIATSFTTKFKVHGSVLTEQNKYIEDSSDYPILKELMAEVKVINETAHELDSTIRTLQADMIEANNEMKTNEATRQANETTRVANEKARKEAETTRANQEVAREQAEATREANEQQRIANENDRIYKENRRESQERDRVSNEYDRQNAEQSREYAEIDRVANEEVRQTNEANRETAEEIRRTNEQARITAETARVTEHEQMRTELNEVKAENAILMENDKKVSDRMTQVEISDKRQYVIMEGLMNSAGDGYLKIEDTGNDTTLYNSVEGFVDVKNITGNTMVNSIKNPDDELTLNADINTSGQSVTLTTAVDNGQVDVLAEGNTMVNVCDQQEAVAITTDTNTFPLRYLYTSTEYTLQFESDTAVTIDITLGGYTLSSQNIVIGLNKINIITPNELTDNNLILNGTGFSASNIVVTEATDKDFGYFSGMKSVGEQEENKIEILSRNKNLFDIDKLIEYSKSINTFISYTDGLFTFKNFILYDVIKNFDPTKNIYIKFNHVENISGNPAIGLGITYEDGSVAYIMSSELGEVSLAHTNKGIRIKQIDWTYANEGLNSVKDIIVSQEPITTYVPHAENKKQILLNEPLRAVGDTKDRFVQIDGKWYVERNCGEVVLDGSELWHTSTQWVDNLHFWCNVEGKATTYGRVLSDKSDEFFGDPYFWIDNIIFKNNTSKFSNLQEFKTWLQTNLPKVVYQLRTPTYEPVEISPTVNTYTDVTHITNNSTIPMNMPIKNSGYEVIAKPSTKYTVVGIDNGRIGDSTIVNGTITTPATITDNFLRPYGTGKTSKVMLLEGELANIPSYFKGIKSVFEDKVTEDGKYACEVRVYNDLGEETKQTLYLDEPLYVDNKLTIYNDKLGYWKNWDKVVLDGSKIVLATWNIKNKTHGCLFAYDLIPNKSKPGDSTITNIMSNKLTARCYSDIYGVDEEGISNYTDKLYSFCARVSKAKLNGKTIVEWFNENPVTVVYQLAEPEFIPLIDNCPNWVIGSWDNCSIHFDSIIPLKDTRYRYTGNVPSVMAMSDDVAEAKSISDQQDSMIIDLATDVAVMEMMLM